jgi:hypothetical protein
MAIIFIIKPLLGTVSGFDQATLRKWIGTNKVYRNHIYTYAAESDIVTATVKATQMTTLAATQTTTLTARDENNKVDNVKRRKITTHNKRSRTDLC